ncbi:hypothetical protein XENORESO_018173 [Xenotaenia resolanae]|uniref:Uncharacterized protein n=1 Tax=Xenotaenia resolanae TaxID=208358 RepID=A0ABV0X9M3_9TELE
MKMSEQMEGGEGESGKVKKTAGQSQQHRPQSCRKEWESQFMWLSPVAGSESKAFCWCCNTELMAEVSALKTTANPKNTERNKSSANTKIHNNVCREHQKRRSWKQRERAEVKLAGF